jgi:hypothetical protein
MNFETGRGYSIILMSLRPNAPYADRFDDESTLVYEGHDRPKSVDLPNPKIADQPEFTPSGGKTENGKFLEAANGFKLGKLSARRVRVYEKIHQGIWSYNGTFDLVDAWHETESKRIVFKFKLVASLGSEEGEGLRSSSSERRRIIPTPVKLEVWKRDLGKCVICGAKDELHFDHDLPYSLGGTSISAANVQLLCARHNLSKGSKLL